MRPYLDTVSAEGYQIGSVYVLFHFVIERHAILIDIRLHRLLLDSGWMNGLVG